MNEQRQSKIAIYGATGYVGGAILTALVQDSADARITVLARDSGNDAAILAAGAHAVAHFDENDPETLQRAVAGIAPDVLFYAGYDVLPHIDAIIAGLAAARKKTAVGSLPVLIVITGTTAILDKSPGVFEEGKTKVWNDMSEEDIKSMPSDAPFHYEKHQRIFRADSERLIDGYIICPPAICGTTSGPGRKSSMFFDIILENCKASGGKVAQVGPGTNISGEIHVEDVASFALFLSKHALSAAAAKTETSSHSKFFFLSAGTFEWRDLNLAAARILHSTGLTASQDVTQMTLEDAKAVGAYYYITAGNQAADAKRALSVGWKPTRPHSLMPHLEDWISHALSLRGGKR